MYTAEFLDLRDGMGWVELWPLPAIFIWNDYGVLITSVVCQELECQMLAAEQSLQEQLQWLANLDQASKDLDKTIFRDLSPTPIP